jgi:hypothetical protein
MRTILIALAIAASTQVPPASRRPAPPALTLVVVETDLACSLTLNGEDQGELPSNGTKTFSLPAGEHVFRAVSIADPSIVWRRVVQISGPERRAVLIELAPLVERKRAGEIDKVKADEAARADERRKAEEAEKARVERERQAADAVRAKEAEQRANEATRALVDTQRLQIDREVSADALKARTDEAQRWIEDFVDNKGKIDPEVTVTVAAGREDDHKILTFEFVRKTRDLKRLVTKVALLQYQGEPTLRFTVRHVHLKECVGNLYVSATRVAYDPLYGPLLKQDAFDVARVVVANPGKITRTGMLKVDIPQRGYDFVLAFEKGDGSWDFLMSEKNFDSAIQLWARRALTDFAGAKRDFERATADIKIASTR